MRVYASKDRKNRVPMKKPVHAVHITASYCHHPAHIVGVVNFMLGDDVGVPKDGVRKRQ
jgi:hypothetical protein